ncbi:MAG: AlpA family phage regulatory protein, partial [Phycisphaera sp. RhM]|nr:AlpA family phage regulatory protein [Phycisphaera sp. RhM]
MASSNNRPRFVEADEIARELNISHNTLAAMIADGRFPAPLRLGLRKRVWLRKTFDCHIA